MSSSTSDTWDTIMHNNIFLLMHIIYLLSRVYSRLTLSASYYYHCINVLLVDQPVIITDHILVQRYRPCLSVFHTSSGLSSSCTVHFVDFQAKVTVFCSLRIWSASKIECQSVSVVTMTTWLTLSAGYGSSAGFVAWVWFGFGHSHHTQI